MATVADIDIFGVEALPQVRVIVINGTLDESNLDALKNKVDPLVVDQQVLCLIFNCKELKYMNSKIVGYFASTYSQMAEKGAKMIMAENNETISDIISMVGLNMIIEQAPTMDEALAMAGNVAVSTAIPSKPVAQEPVPVANSTPVEDPVQQAQAESGISIPEPAPTQPASDVPSMPSKSPIVEQTASPKSPVLSDPVPSQNQPVATSVPADNAGEQKAVEPPISESSIATISTPAVTKEPSVVETAPTLSSSNKTIPDPTRKSTVSVPVKELKSDSEVYPPHTSTSSVPASDEVVVMLELPQDMGGEGSNTYMTGDGNISARILTDGLGRHIEIRFKPGKYFFKGKHDTSSQSSSNTTPKPPEDHPKKSFFGGLFGKK